MGLNNQDLLLLSTPSPLSTCRILPCETTPHVPEWLCVWGSLCLIKPFSYIQVNHGSVSFCFNPWDFDVFNMLQSNTKLPVRRSWMLLPSLTYIRIMVPPAWNTFWPWSLSSLLWHSLRGSSRAAFSSSLWILARLPTFFLETFFNPNATWGLPKLSLSAGGMGSRAFQETSGVTGIAIPQISGQNKVGEVSGPKEELMGDPRCATGCIFCISPVILED